MKNVKNGVESKKVYVVYTEDEWGVCIYKNLKNLAAQEMYCISVHSLYKHDFTAKWYCKGKYSIFMQYVL